jgi:rSAM/selenodomain-associated transferase 1
MDKPKGIILFFVKFPDPGRVKTRLSRVLGDERGAAIYSAFVLDMLDTLVLSGYPLAVCFAPQARMEAFRSWLGHGWIYLPQQGEDLGERMKNGFQDAFRMGYHKAILIGSDFPDLPAEIIGEAFSSLERHPAVIGPALDGGYYLIGFGRETFAPSVFDRVAWGRDTVLQRTLSRFKEMRQQVHILPAWNDVDTHEDLLDLYRRGKGTHFARSRTMTCLASLLDVDDQGGRALD